MKPPITAKYAASNPLLRVRPRGKVVGFIALTVGFIMLPIIIGVIHLMLYGLIEAIL